MTPCLNGQSTIFCINTETEVTLISGKAHAKISGPEMKLLDKT